MFEVEGGHGRTLWTRRRIEDTRPSIVDPVSVLDAAAHRSHGVTQKNRSSRSMERRLVVEELFALPQKHHGFVVAFA